MSRYSLLMNSAKRMLSEDEAGDYVGCPVDALAMFPEKFSELRFGTLKCEVLSDFQTSLPPAKALA